MTHVASLLFCIICILIIAFDSFKARFEFWYPMLVILNLSIFVLISRNFSLFKKHNLLLSFILFPLVAFSGFIFWTYILNFIPLNIFGDPRGDTFHYFSLIAPGLIAAIGFFLAVSVPASLIFGRLSFLIPLCVMLQMMFAHETWFVINDLIDKVILFENLCLGLIVTPAFYYLNTYVQTKIT